MQKSTQTNLMFGKINMIFNKRINANSIGLAHSNINFDNQVFQELNLVEEGNFSLCLKAEVSLPLM
jgi:hypothetical protein